MTRRQPAMVRHWRWLLVAALLAGYWLLPISGQVLVVPGKRDAVLAWPRIQVAPTTIAVGQTVTVDVTDVAPWAHTRLTINGQSAGADTWHVLPGGTWTWRWTTPLTPAMLAATDRGLAVAFYRDCDTGCQLRGVATLDRSGVPAVAPTVGVARAPTKLGVVFADPARDWHGRQGWTVELSYARLADSTAVQDEQWVMDGVAARVARARAAGLRVLVRVDYDRGQSLPPAGDELALTDYLRHVRRLARDERLRDVYAFVIGAAPNAADSNQHSGGQPLPPAWYARLFNGYGEAAHRGDNVTHVIRTESPRARVLVGPVRPWTRDGTDHYGRPDAPWLGYSAALVAALDTSARAKALAGVPFAAPDGFALHVPGRPELARARGLVAADEPRVSLTGPEGSAERGFRVYTDFLAIVNAHPTVRGLPAYITATNTFAPDDGILPAQGYPPGWLTTALAVIDAEPQVAALCWFADGPLGDRQWDWFSLSRPTGRLIDAADEFDRLLRPLVTSDQRQAGPRAALPDPVR